MMGARFATMMRAVLMTEATDTTTRDCKAMMNLARLLINFGEVEAKKLCAMIHAIVLELHPDGDVLERALAYAAAQSCAGKSPREIVMNIYWVTRKMAEVKGFPTLSGGVTCG